MKSSYLRLQDCRSIIRMVGECRELGDDPTTWRRHCVEQLARLVDADLGFCGEIAGIRASKANTLGLADWGWGNGFSQTVFLDHFDVIENDPANFAIIRSYYEKMLQDDGVCHSRRDMALDRDWYKSPDYQLIQHSIGADHTLWCFRSLPARSGDEFSGVTLVRTIGRRDFAMRDRLIVCEVHAALAPLIGGPLARFGEPSPRDLSVRAREVLRCLLEGDSDKQIAARLKLSRFTVNQYTKLIYRLFGVKARAELLSRWIRRGWGSRFSWLDQERSSRTCNVTAPRGSSKDRGNTPPKPAPEIGRT
jgi:DNA-binding CsgD family transcriptional regulator